MFRFAVSTISTSVCVTLTIALLANQALGSAMPISRLCLIYSAAAAAATSAAVMGLALLARLSIIQTIVSTVAFAAGLALAWKRMEFEPYLCAIAGPVGRAFCGDAKSDAQNTACLADPTAVASKAPSGQPADWIGELLPLRPEERDLLAGASQEGASLREVDEALGVVMRLLIHPTLVQDCAVRARLVDCQRCLHARHALLRAHAQAHAEGGGIGRSAAVAQIQARLARLNSSLGREYSDD